MTRALTAVAVADFRERVRRPSYLVILAAAVGLGFLAVPAPESHWVVFDAGGYRGVYGTGYVATVTALAGALWFSLAGFYVVRGTIRRDERTGVGQLLAATPIRSLGYLLGKFLSNLLVLASMAGVLAITAVVMQLLRGESRAVDPVALLLPFLLLALPVLAATAAAALLLDTVPLLRAGLGNVLWVFGWLVAAIIGHGPAAPFGGLGVHRVSESMHAALAEQQLATGGAEFGLGLMQHDRPLSTFEWPGLAIDAALVTDRSLLLLAALGVAMAPALWFGRFDPARQRRPGPAPATVPAGATPAGEVPLAGYPGLPRTAALRSGGTWRRLVAGELRILLQGTSRWWWAGTVLLTAVTLLSPYPLVTGAGLLAAGIWPVVIWSRLGTQRYEFGMVALLRAYPSAHRQLLAQWLAGVAVTGLVGSGPVTRMLVAADLPGLATWGAGALFVPALAFGLGSLSHSPRLFQASYVGLWLLVVNGVAAVDFLGAVRVDGAPVGPSPLLLVTAGAVLLAGSAGLGALQHARR